VAAPRGRPALNVVLLAGGSGTRFWPASRARRPKQLLALSGRRPLLVETWTRARRLVPAARIWVVVPAALVEPVRALLPALRSDRLIVEPAPRDTAPAVTLASATLARRAPGSVVAILPTDHVIRDVRVFTESVRLAAAAAAAGGLVCLGVRPDRPATGFGYLRCAGAPRAGRVTDVAKFVEKPDLARARAFLASGRYLWNAGMFVWQPERFLGEARRVVPALVRSVEAHLDGRRGAWSRAERLSVDYAVMEHAKGVRVVPLDAGWDDVGSWDAAAGLREEAGIGEGGHLMIDSPGAAVFGAERLVALVDVPGVVVVDTPDALLVVARRSSQKVGRVVAELRRSGREDLL
jgi:mannose-1-phosphate guanylyltransferase